MIRIAPADLDDPRIADLLLRHMTRAHAETAPGSAHALDVTGMRSPDIALFAGWEGDTLVAIGALRQLSASEGEIKSMFTAEAGRRRGAGSAMLRHLIAAARAGGMTRLSLETGSWPYFAPARALYRRHGFGECAPFGDYVPDRNSLFMTLDL